MFGSDPNGEGAIPPAFPGDLYDPTVVRAMSAGVGIRILDENKQVMVAPGDVGTFNGRIVIGGSVVQEELTTPRIIAEIDIANPNYDYSTLFVEGMVIYLEYSLTYNNGRTYQTNLGGRLGITQIKTDRTALDNRIHLQAIQSAQLELLFYLNGDLPALARTVAATYNLLWPVGNIASVEGIMAYLAMYGGALGVRVEGSWDLTPAFTTLYADGTYVSPWVLGEAEQGGAVMRRLADAAGVDYWTDWDSTFLIRPRPRSVQDLGNKAPVRLYRTYGKDVSMVRISPAVAVPIEQVEIINQTTAGPSSRQGFLTPPGTGQPQRTTLPVGPQAGLYLPYNVSTYPSTAFDVNNSMARRGEQLAFDGMLRGTEAEIDIVPDPWVESGLTVELDIPVLNLQGNYWVKRSTMPLGKGPQQLFLQKIYDLTSNTGNNRAARLTIGSNGAVLGPVGLVPGPGLTSRYNVFTYTFEGWMRFDVWPKLAGSNLTLQVLNTCDLDVYMTGAGSSMNCFLRVWDGTTLHSTLGPFSVANADAAWRHWAIQRESNYVALWIDGVLKAEFTGSLPASGIRISPVGLFQNPNFAHPGPSEFPQYSLQELSAIGDASVYYWRFRQAAVHPRSASFTPPTTKYSDPSSTYPTTLAIWPLLVDLHTVASTVLSVFSPSTMSGEYALIISSGVTAAFATWFAGPVS